MIWAKDSGVAQEIAKDLDEAANMIAAVGRFKTVGYGEVVCMTLDWQSEDAGLAPVTGAAALREFDLSFCLSKPAMVAAEYSDSNTLQSGQRIPGGMIKGAVAQHLRMLGHIPETGELGAALSALRVGEAEPQGIAPTIPLDTVEPEDLTAPDTRWDKATLKQPGCGKGIKFTPDFKRDRNPVSLETETRTRLRIDEKRQAAASGALFSQTLVRPDWPDGTPVIWRSRVDASACPTSTKAEQAARDLVSSALMGGPASLGKTSARMTNLAAAPVPVSPAPGLGRLRVTIRTPTLMLREAHLADTSAYHAALRAYWDCVTGGAYRLADDDGPPDFPPLPAVFASLSLHGGYEARKFRFFGDQVVEPFVLTDPGSVFVLEPVGRPQPSVLAGLSASGLPLVEWAGETPALSAKAWRDCPYLPENGFGAIAVEDAA